MFSSERSILRRIYKKMLDSNFSQQPMSMFGKVIPRRLVMHLIAYARSCKTSVRRTSTDLRSWSALFTEWHVTPFNL